MGQEGATHRGFLSFCPAEIIVGMNVNSKKLVQVLEQSEEPEGKTSVITEELGGSMTPEKSKKNAEFFFAQVFRRCRRFSRRDFRHWGSQNP